MPTNKSNREREHENIHHDARSAAWLLLMPYAYDAPLPPTPQRDGTGLKLDVTERYVLSRRSF